MGDQFARSLPTSPAEQQFKPVRYLRPPGARPGDAFADLCSGCTACVEACPAHCIEFNVGHAQDLPYIVARQRACVVCDELACMKACPTGALELVGDVAEIAMGTAFVNHTRCLREDDGQGEDCRVCVRHCPVGETALSIDDAGRVAVGDACIGCGICEERCPTEPASIIVLARDTLPRAGTATPNA